MKFNTKKLIISAMFAAMVCVATMVIKFQITLGGYVNLGDCMVLLAGWMLSPGMAFLAAGIGSAAADAILGYGIYIPATFVIKGLMAAMAGWLFGRLKKVTKPVAARVASALCAEVWMALGYYLFDGILYGFIPALATFYGNALQGVTGLILGVIFVNIFVKNKVMDYIKKD